MCDGFLEGQVGFGLSGLLRKGPDSGFGGMGALRWIEADFCRLPTSMNTSAILHLLTKRPPQLPTSAFLVTNLALLSTGGPFGS